MASVRSALSGESGVQNVNVDLEGKQAKVIFDDQRATVPALVAAVSKAGFEAKPMS